MSDIADLTAKAYEIARLIPHGRVTTYGHIARLAGYPTYPRHVGNAMKMLPGDSDVPWQRVISAKGTLSPRGDQGQGVARQKARLEQEGVQVDTSAAGEERVDLRTFGWFPVRVAIGDA